MRMNKTATNGVRRGGAMLAAMVLAAAVSGCGATENTRGNLPLAEAIDEIKAGQQSRRQIIRILGSPSTTGTFEKQEVWYYIGEKTETLAFFKPTIIERKILMIKFNKLGQVAEVKHYNAADGKPITMVKRITPTKGKELGFFEQIIGNVGRFGNRKDDE